MAPLAFPSLPPCSLLLGGGTISSRPSDPLINSQLPKSASLVGKWSSSSSLSLSISSRCARARAAGKEDNHIMTSTNSTGSSVDVEKQKLVEELKLSLKEELMPKHVAVIMDGNGRWATERGLSAMYGHGAARMALKALIRHCINLGIKTLTVFPFSTGDWSTPKEEVESLMGVFEEVIRPDLEEMMELNVRASIIGERSTLPEPLQEMITEAEDRTRANSGMELKLALNYSGKYDIIQACKSVAAKVKDGTILDTDNITEDIFEQELVTKFGEYPYPDLLIRTSGEITLSDFMLWQLAYTELYFTDVHFPDFGEEELVNALIAYQKRDPCYGRV